MKLHLSSDKDKSDTEALIAKLNEVMRTATVRGDLALLAVAVFSGEYAADQITVIPKNAGKAERETVIRENKLKMNFFDDFVRTAKAERLAEIVHEVIG
jgi:hypothetical protein